MDATTAAARMLSHSDEFFKYYPVNVAGGTGGFVANAANPKPYWLMKKSGSSQIGGTQGHFGATRPGFLHTKEISSFLMCTYAQPNSSPQLSTDGVPMVNYNSNKDGKVNLNGNVTAMDHYIVGAAVDYMTTGGLSGCCFAWTPNPGGLWCVHIRPEGTDGVHLQNAVATNGRFAAAPHTPLSTFGRSDYGDGNAIVIGVNAPGGWKLYAQTTVNAFATITGAWRLYPGAVVRL